MQGIVMTLYLLSLLFAAEISAQGNSSSAHAITPVVDPSVVEGADIYLKAVLAGDVKSVSSMFAENALLMPPNEPLIRGRAAIEQFYRGWLSSPARPTKFTFSHLESPVLGDMAYDVGTYSLSFSPGPGQNVTESGKYTVVLKRSGDRWQIVHLIVSSDLPPRTPPGK
jgi:ketosteroid isomerase-like protein